MEKKRKKEIVEGLENDVKKVIKYPIEAKIKIYFGNSINIQEFQIKNRFHLINTLSLGIAMGNEQGKLPNKIEIYDNKDRLIGEASC